MIVRVDSTRRVPLPRRLPARRGRGGGARRGARRVDGPGQLGALDRGRCARSARSPTASTSGTGRSTWCSTRTEPGSAGSRSSPRALAVTAGDRDALVLRRRTPDPAQRSRARCDRGPHARAPRDRCRSRPRSVAAAPRRVDDGCRLRRRASRPSPERASARARPDPAKTRVLMLGDSQMFTLLFYGDRRLRHVGTAVRVRADHRLRRVRLRHARRQLRGPGARRGDTQIRTFDPDLSVLLIGAWETLDFHVDGHTYEHGTPEHDRELVEAHRPRRCARSPRATGASRCSRCRASARTRATRAASERDDPGSVAGVNDALRAVARRLPDQVTFVPWATRSVRAGTSRRRSTASWSGPTACTSPALARPGWRPIASHRSCAGSRSRPIAKRSTRRRAHAGQRTAQRVDPGARRCRCRSIAFCTPFTTVAT